MYSITDLLIRTVRFYQRNAPPVVRAACGSTPCCSDYMIGSIQKFGVKLGVAKGIQRIVRCRPEAGYVDYP